MSIERGYIRLQNRSKNTAKVKIFLPSVGQKYLAVCHSKQESCLRLLHQTDHLGADHHLIAKTHSGHSAQAPEVQIAIFTYPFYAAFTENKKGL
jgi:hypothetical protein